MCLPKTRVLERWVNNVFRGALYVFVGTGLWKIYKLREGNLFSLAKGIKSEDSK